MNFKNSKVTYSLQKVQLFSELLRLFTPELSLKFQVAGYIQLVGGELYSLEVLDQFRFRETAHPPLP